MRLERPSFWSGYVIFFGCQQSHWVNYCLRAVFEMITMSMTKCRKWLMIGWRHGAAKRDGCSWHVAACLSVSCGTLNVVTLDSYREVNDRECRNLGFAKHYFRRSPHPRFSFSVCSWSMRTVFKKILVEMASWIFLHATLWILNIVDRIVSIIAGNHLQVGLSDVIAPVLMLIATWREEFCSQPCTRFWLGTLFWP